MKHNSVTPRPLTIAAIAAFTLGPLAAPAAAQQCGDVTADGRLGAADALAVLKAAVGQDVDLTCEGECEALEPRLAALEALLANLTIDGDNLVLTGMNFQVVSGSGETDGKINGKGNIILGYDEANGGDDKTGSHNLVIGALHSYPTWGGIVAGLNNEITGASAGVLGGANSLASGDGAVVVGGEGNEARGDQTGILGGIENRTDGTYSSIVGGEDNYCAARASVVGGGRSNSANSSWSTMSGGSFRSLNGNGSWMGGSWFSVQ